MAKRTKPLKRKLWGTHTDRLNLKLEPGEREEMQAKADKHTDGNLSAWLRKAGREYSPK